MASFYRREVLQQAWNMIWRKKYLWFAGLFAGLASYGGEVNFLFRKLNSVTTFDSYLQSVRSLFVEGKAQTYVHQAKNVFVSAPWNVLGYVAILIIIAGALLWLMLISQAIIVRITGRTQEKKTTSFFDGVSTGTDKFGAMLQLNIITLLLGWAVWLILAGLPAVIFFSTGQNGWSVAAGFGSFLSVVASGVIALLTQYSTAGIILRGMKPMPALVDSWNLFRGNMVVSLEMVIIIFLINFGVLLVSFGIFDSLGLLYSVWGFITLLVLTVVEYSMLSAFSFSAWTVMYTKLVNGTAQSKIGEWTTSLVNFAGSKKSSS